MKVIDKPMLLEFRLMRQCAWCRAKVQECDPAHIFSRGAGRVDIRENVVNLCFRCHRSSHDGNGPTRDELLAIAAQRERTSAEAIWERVMRLRRDQRCKVWDVETMGEAPV